MSCLANYDIEQGDAFTTYTPLGNTTDGQAQECAQQCQLDGRCDGFTLSYTMGCELRSGRYFSNFLSGDANSSVTPVYSPSTDVVLSCLKEAADFDAAGRYGSEQISGVAQTLK